MGLTKDLGHRIELVSMDPYYENISISLYRRELETGPAYLVHTYSGKAGAENRISSAVGAMQTLGSMVLTPEGLLRFPCGDGHELACRRLFLEACKMDPAQEVDVKPLTLLDRKSGLTMNVTSLGDGYYEVHAEGEGKNRERRVTNVTGGLMKLGEMHAVNDSDSQTAFPCGQAHDALVGVLLVRAPNVRAALREQELAAARGVLSSPSQQK
jgi:hypothetical protein